MLEFKARADGRLPQFAEFRVLSWPELQDALARPLLLACPVQLHLMRHGETVTNARSLVTGSQDVSLTANGEDQARRIGRQLDPHYDLALHSTLSRSRQTLLLALQAGHTRVGETRSDPRLNERSLGVVELQPWRPVDEYARGDLDYAPEGGDSYAEVARRCLSLLLDLVDFIAAARPERILVCSHMGPMRIFLGILEERSDPVEVLARSFDNTEVIRVPWKRLVLPGFLKAEVYR
ncbi:MAG: histidine phosphatase family protein [Gemmataceae bacterium]